ncbi:adenylate/guanylate cyclase domain-containing protein [Kribbia dieselivorans]|uniref:adenylate/guanylate cyclase domain-containing protein n=1 Tax=Kribbia dieselivorans TaxID=331526 RepID=UPI0009F82BA2|nr:adenylate/guanylate cyclase domain-containing protein [Kribbia dieselivorans]
MTESADAPADHEPAVENGHVANGRVEDVPPHDAPHSLEEALLGAAATFGRAEVAREADVPQLSARRFWHALGFPVVQSTDEMFTASDVEALRRVAALVRDDVVDEELALGMARAMARTTDRLAVWQTQLVREALTESADSSGGSHGESVDPQTRAELAREVTDRIVALADELEPMMIYIWRRQLTAALNRVMADAAPEAPGAESRIIGFADLVNFTAVVRRMTERELGNLVVRFETIAQDVVTAHGGRLVKTVGDEVMFSHNDARAAAGLAMDLVEAIAEEPALPPVRVGMASGTVLSRFGDVYGTTVNRAARMTAIAPTGGVLIDDALAQRVAVVSGFQLTKERRRVLRGIGSVTPSRLHRSTGDRAVDDAPVPPKTATLAERGSDTPAPSQRPTPRWYDAG